VSVRSSADTDDLVRELRRAARAAGAPDDFEPGLERPRDPEHGDYASNVALVLAKRLGVPPRQLAARIEEALDTQAAGVTEVHVAGPGFLNFRLADRLIWQELAGILAADDTYGRSDVGASRRVNVEFVSANPTGPLHVAHGRGAALGDAVASLLEWTGSEVVREFYVNDAGRQIQLLGESVESHFQNLLGREAAIPEGGYHGAYVADLARAIADEVDRGELAALPREKRVQRFADMASAELLEEQRRDLEAFGVRMDVFRRESELVAEGRIDELLGRFEAAEVLYRDAGAVWLRTADLGDEKDRVLVKSDGSYTYFTPDIAYHLDKAERGFDLAIDIWGADHHGHEKRMQAALSGLERPDFLEVLILQLVTVMRGGVEARMSKRAGRFVTLRELFEVTGPDVARYFFLMRRPEVHLNFDLDLALDTSEANPVFKVQYAHARMCSVFRKGGVDERSIPVSADGLDSLSTPEERAVAKALVRFPEIVTAAADARTPHLVCAYLDETAGLVNSWYHKGNLDPSLRVLAGGPAREARLKLARAVRITLRNGLMLLGLTAPEQMQREEDAP
jgi:arginyl-tRNA synthetase